ncbi:MAG: 23S rRNA (pseudouridine(1915)-N(3))-methyltransferase RlmH [Candidatus Saccharimonadales bacterium]
MNIQLVTVGKPKLAYAKSGWDEYLARLQRQHTIRVTQLADKFAYDAPKILEASSGTYRVALVIEGQQFSSQGLAEFLQKRELESREVSFIIGGPEGLPAEVIEKSDFKWSLGKLTLPHDLAMVVALEALYRASTINAGRPYHK